MFSCIRLHISLNFAAKTGVNTRVTVYLFVLWLVKVNICLRIFI
jgi:hypothetical protein